MKYAESVSRPTNQQDAAGHDRKADDHDVSLLRLAVDRLQIEAAVLQCPVDYRSVAPPEARGTSDKDVQLLKRIPDFDAKFFSRGVGIFPEPVYFSLQAGAIHINGLQVAAITVQQPAIQGPRFFLFPR